MKKRYLLLVLSLVAAVSFAGCKDKEDPQANAPAPTIQVVTDTPTITTEDAPVEISFAELKPEKVTAAILTQEMHAHNTFDDPDRVKEEAFTAYEVKDGRMCFTAPACSVISFRVK